MITIMSMVITIITRMSIEMMPTPHLVTLMQWLSPAYPVGGFSYSHGLEWAVGAGDVTDAAGFQEWLADILEYGSGRNDAILLAAAYRAPDTAALHHVDAVARALAPSAERLLETTAQGAALVPLGQTEGQRVLAAMTRLCDLLAQEALAGDGLDDLGGCTLLADVAAMKHETQYTRLFRS